MGRIYDIVKQRYGQKVNNESMETTCSELETIVAVPGNESLALLHVVRLHTQCYFKWLALELLQKGASLYYIDADSLTVVALINVAPGWALDDVMLYRSALIAIQSGRIHPRLQKPKYSKWMNKIPKEIWIKVMAMIED